MSTLFGVKPKAPPPPPPPEPAPTMDNEAVEDARKRQIAAARMRSGRASTVFTRGTRELRDTLG